MSRELSGHTIHNEPHPKGQSQAWWSGRFMAECGEFEEFVGVLVSNVKAGIHSNSCMVEYKKALIQRFEHLAESRRILEQKTLELAKELTEQEDCDVIS